MVFAYSHDGSPIAFESRRKDLFFWDMKIIILCKVVG